MWTVIPKQTCYSLTNTLLPWLLVLSAFGLSVLSLSVVALNAEQIHFLHGSETTDGSSYHLKWEKLPAVVRLPTLDVKALEVICQSECSSLKV